MCINVSTKVSKRYDGVVYTPLQRQSNFPIVVTRAQAELTASDPSYYFSA